MSEPWVERCSAFGKPVGGEACESDKCCLICKHKIFRERKQ
jgi:hypothetical protein